jgi:hypothetical protein
MLDATEPLQLILGPDKRNPSFCPYTDAPGQQLHVYYGLELLEVVPKDRDSPAYRLLAARLYNARVRVATLEAVFGLDRKTMRKWGQALRSGDRDWLAEVLASRWGRRKFTVEMESYVRTRWPALQGQRDYRRRLQAELERVFGIKVSGETLRPVLRQLRHPSAAVPTPCAALRTAETAASSQSPPPAASVQPSLPLPAPQTSSPAPGQRTAPAVTGNVSAGEPEATATVVLVAQPEPQAKPIPESTTDSKALPSAGVTALSPAPPELNSAPAPARIVETPSAEPGAQSLPAPASPSTPADVAEVSCVWTPGAALPWPSSRKLLPSLEDWTVGQTAWCEHAGLLLFAEALAGIGSVVEPAQPWLRQALGGVLAGALNVEQTKYLNPEDLDRLLGPTLRGLGPQRQRLKELAAGPTADALLRWNGQRVGAAAHSDFYLDPHTKHYTGMAAVLKGWCPTIRWADKALHSDFLHTVQGQPIYFECTDNYEDLRARLWGVLSRARAALGWPKDKPLTLVIDRAVFGQETFEKVLAEPALHLVTWQKGYPPGGWDETKVSGQCVIERPRNRAADVQSYQFRYLDQKWPADPRWRQLIVRATNPWGRTVEVAILTDDHTRPASELVRRMFGRWVQENDFKYLDQHFGINQITSYGVIEYVELKSQLTDRQVENGAYRALQEEGRQVRAQLGRRLWAQRQSEQRQAARQARLAALEPLPVAAPAHTPDPQPPADAAACRRERARLKAAQTREENSRKARQNKIAALEQQWTQLAAQAAQTQQSVSRLEDLITRQMVRLDTGPKRLLDTIKVVARNEFYRALGPFRTAYDNYRDDHEHFRRLTQSAGALRWNGRELEVHLLPQVPYGAALRRVWEQVLAGVNAAELLWPDGSGRRLWFRLAARSELQVSLRPI